MGEFSCSMMRIIRHISSENYYALPSTRSHFSKQAVKFLFEFFVSVAWSLGHVVVGHQKEFKQMPWLLAIPQGSRKIYRKQICRRKTRLRNFRLRKFRLIGKIAVRQFCRKKMFYLLNTQVFFFYLF